MKPETRIAIPFVMLVFLGWFVISTVRERDLIKLEGIFAVQAQKMEELQKQSAAAVLTSERAAKVAEEIKLKQTAADVTAEYVARALLDLKVDVRTIGADVQAIRKSAPQ
jgi:hypothetical protein